MVCRKIGIAWFSFFPYLNDPLMYIFVNWIHLFFSFVTQSDFQAQSDIKSLEQSFDQAHKRYNKLRDTIEHYKQVTNWF